MIYDSEARANVTETRSTPTLLIVDGTGDVVARSGDVPADETLVTTRECALAIRRIVATLKAGSNVATVDLIDGRCLRGVPLRGLVEAYAIFVERVRAPIAPDALVERYALSCREAEVVALLVRGATSHEIAARLQIAETTVVSHVRNAGIKLGCTKRSTIVARVLGFDEFEAV